MHHTIKLRTATILRQISKRHAAQALSTRIPVRRIGRRVLITRSAIEFFARAQNLNESPERESLSVRSGACGNRPLEEALR
jgi:hypothetical protein